MRCKTACISATWIWRGVHRSVNCDMRFSPHLLPKPQPSRDPTLKAAIYSPPFPAKAPGRWFKLQSDILKFSEGAASREPKWSYLLPLVLLPFLLLVTIVLRPNSRVNMLCQLNRSLRTMIQSILAPKLVNPQLLCRLEFRAELEAEIWAKIKVKFTPPRIPCMPWRVFLIKIAGPKLHYRQLVHSPSLKPKVHRISK